MLAQALGDIDEKLVPGFVAEGVVDLLEPVQVEEDQHALDLVALGVVDRQFRAVAEEQAVRQPGEQVVVGEEADALLALLRVADVLQGADVAAHRPRVVAERGDREERGVQLPGLAAVPDLAAPGAGGGEIPPHVAIEVLRVAAGLEQVRLATDGFRRRVAVDGGKRRVHADDDGIAIGDDHPLRDVLEDHPGEREVPVRLNQLPCRVARAPHVSQALPEDEPVRGLDDEVRRPGLVGPLDGRQVVQPGHHADGDLARLRVAVQLPAERDAVDAGEIDVEEDDVGPEGFQSRARSRNVFRGFHRKPRRAERRPGDHAHAAVVVHDENADRLLRPRRGFRTHRSPLATAASNTVRTCLELGRRVRGERCRRTVDGPGGAEVFEFLAEAHQPDGAEVGAGRLETVGRAPQGIRVGAPDGVADRLHQRRAVLEIEGDGLAHHAGDPLPLDGAEGLESLGVEEVSFLRRRGWRCRGGHDSRGGLLDGLQPARKDLLELVDPERLAEVIVHASRQAQLAVAFEGVGGEGHDRRPPAAVRAAALLFADRPGRLVPVHLGHLAVHEDQVEVRRAPRRHGLAAVPRDLDPQAEDRENAGDHLLVHAVVLGQQDPCVEAAVRLGGRRRRVRPPAPPPAGRGASRGPGGGAPREPAC